MEATSIVYGYGIGKWLMAIKDYAMGEHLQHEYSERVWRVFACPDCLGTLEHAGDGAGRLSEDDSGKRGYQSALTSVRRDLTTAWTSVLH